VSEEAQRIASAVTTPDQSIWTRAALHLRFPCASCLFARAHG
jgi:hypothetical protein